MQDKVRKEVDFFKLVKRGLISGIIVLSAFVITLLFFSGKLSSLILEGTNQFLRQQLSLQISGTIDGSIISDGLHIRDFVLTEADSNQPLIKASRMSIGFHWSSIFKKNITLSHIILNHAVVDSALWKWHKKGDETNSRSPNFNIIFNRLALDSTTVFFPQSQQMDGLLVEHYLGSGWLLDGIVYINTDTASVNMGWPLSQSVHFAGGASFDAASSGQLIDFGITLASGSGSINAEWVADSIGMNVQIPKFDLRRFFNLDSLMWPYDNMQISDFDINLNHQDKAWFGSAIGKSRINQHDTQVNLAQLKWDSTGYSGDLEFSSQSETLQLSGEMTPGRRLNFSGNFKNLDITNDYKEIPVSNLSGKFSLIGDQMSQKSMVQLHHFKIANYRIDDLSLQFSRDNQNRFQVDSLQIELGGTRLFLAGNLTPDSLTMTGSASIADISQWITPKDSVDLKGRIDLDFSIRGTLSAPEITGVFQQRDFGIENTLTLDGLGKFNLRKSRDSWRGDLAIQSNEGTLVADSLKSLSLTASLDNGKITITNLNVRSVRYLLAGNGFISPDSIAIDRLSVLIDNLAISLAEPLKMYRNGNTDAPWIIPRSVVTVNRGGLAIEGQISQQGRLDLSVNAELIATSIFAEIFNLTFPLSGDLTGNFILSDKFTNPTVTANFEWQKPVLNQLAADNFKFDGVLENGKIRATSAELSRGASKVFVSGSFPIGFTKAQWEQARTEPQLFTAKLTNYRLKDLLITEFLRTPVAGIVTGSINVRGTAAETILDGDISINEGRWGKLDFNHGIAILNYQKGIINFDSLGIISTWGVAKGAGYLSAYLDLRPEKRSPAVENPMDLTFQGNFSQLKFLTAYINGLDDLTGEFTADMHLYGTYKNPIRDMKFRGHHANLTMGFLDNKVTDIHTELTMQNNIMTINHFSGKLRYNEGTVLQRGGLVPSVTKLFGSLIGIQNANQYNGDLQITGIGDFSSFFHPRFNLRLVGDEIYYRNIAGGVEAISDMDMTIEGQDTLRINAEMPVVNAIYYSNFSTQQTYDVKALPVVQASRRMISYNLHTTFTGNLRIDNTYMSSEFEGDLYLQDYGDGHLRFSGTLDAIEGGKFYYLGNVLSITQGTLSFDPVEFNPTISFTVRTTIDDKEVVLNLTGDMKEPQLSLAPESSPDLNMDDILTYLTLNQKVSGGLTLAANSFRDPVRSYVGLLVNKTGERFLNRIGGLDYLDIQSPYLGAAGDTTRILVGQRISRDIKMTYQTDINRLDPNPDYKFGVEYRVNKNVSIIGNVDQDGLVEVRSRLRYSY